MDKTIENKFFEAFKCGGVVNKCIDCMRFTYNLPPMKPLQNKKSQKAVNEKWRKIYEETLPKEIIEATKAFDDSVIRYMDSPLMDEIESNLNECQTDAQKERYLYSLLKPFGEIPNGCGIARIYTPTAEINLLNEEIRKCEKDKAFWETLPQDEVLKNTNGKPSGTPKEQIKACDNFIKKYKEQIDWTLYVNTQFCNLTGKYEEGVKWMQEGTVEHCLSYFVKIKRIFANRLDALLLTYGIDLMKLQRDSGLYLKSSRLITDVADYIGSFELAQKYINALPQETSVLNTEKATATIKNKRSKGTTSDNINTYILTSNIEDFKTSMSKLLNGLKGMKAAIYIYMAVSKGYLQKTTSSMLQTEFGFSGTLSAFNIGYRKISDSPKLYDSDINAAHAALQRLLNKE